MRAITRQVGHLHNGGYRGTTRCQLGLLLNIIAQNGMIWGILQETKRQHSHDGCLHPPIELHRPEHWNR